MLGFCSCLELLCWGPDCFQDVAGKRVMDARGAYKPCGGPGVWSMTCLFFGSTLLWAALSLDSGIFSWNTHPLPTHWTLWKMLMATSSTSSTRSESTSSPILTSKFWLSPGEPGHLPEQAWSGLSAPGGRGVLSGFSGGCTLPSDSAGSFDIPGQLLRSPPTQHPLTNNDQAKRVLFGGRGGCSTTWPRTTHPCGHLSVTYLLGTWPSVMNGIFQRNNLSKTWYVA